MIDHGDTVHEQIFHSRGIMMRIGIARTIGDPGRIEQHEIGEMTGALKNLSRTLDCAVVLLSQLNREAEKRDNKRPQLSDLRDSGSIEQDADVILGLYREAYYLKRDAEAGDADATARLPEVERQLEITILKQRNGETGRVLAFADIGCNVVTGLAE